ncbi:PilN domain-containing protein [Breoghania sp.]|uniref:PilN domain-containing protein n=1 Tax=Breoghania sp. TaxID=2065378 RepID=UPI002AAB9303|nr:PilN domain-containing protein [Breoghania sp.]
MARLTDNSSLPWLQDGVLAFWSWWRGELSASFAPLLRLARLRKTSGPRVRLSRTRGGDAANGTGLAATLDAESWQALAKALANTRHRAQPLVLELASDLVLVRKQTYPAGALSKLDDIVALDIEQSTPFSGASAVWRWQVTGRADRQVEVETVILRRDLVLQILSLASANGLGVGEITYRGMESGRVLELMRLETPHDQFRRRWRRLNAGLAVVVLLLAAGLAGLSYWQREVALEGANARLEELKSRAIRLRRAQADAVAEYDASVALLREKATTPQVNAVWNALSASLPDTVFLSSLEISADKGRIAGFARSAAPLIARLEELDEVADVTFASPVMINPDDRLERFDITFALEATGGADND